MFLTQEKPAAAEASFDSFGPISLVVIQGTSLCNLNCDYCYLPGRQFNNQISLDLIDPIFEKIFTSPLLQRRFTICWHAGEPLTVPQSFYQEAFELIDQASEKYNKQGIEYSYSIQTNGTLINQKWCDFIKAHKIHVGVSIDGPEAIHNAHRKNWQGDGTHAQTMRGINLLKQNKVQFHLISVLTKEALLCPDEMFQFFLENNLKQVGFNVEEIEGVNESSSLGEVGGEAQYHKFMERIWQLNAEAKGVLKVREFDRICGQICSDKKLGRSDMVKPFSIINIDNKGNYSTFSPELLAMEGGEDYDNFILGNILTDSFEDAASSEKFQRMYGEIKAGVDQCEASCQYFDMCGGGAPSNKYWENKSFNSTETQFCRLNKKVVTELVLQKLESSLDIN